MLWWTKRHLHSADPGVRIEAVRKLAASGDVGVLEPLVTVLGDSVEAVRKEALAALGKLDPNWRKSASAQAAAAVMITALGNKKGGVTVGEVEALGALRDARALEGLVATLRDRNDSTRRAAAAALEQTDPRWRSSGPARALVQELIKGLADSSEGVRKEAAEELGLVGVAEAVEPLIAALRDSSSLVRGAAAKALGSTGDPRAIEPMAAALKDPESFVRMGAADGLGASHDPRAFEPLTSLLDDQDGWVRMSAATALGNLGDPRGLQFLLAICIGDQALPCMAALKALDKLEPKWRSLEMTQNAVRELQATLTDEGKANRTRLAAAMVMTKIDPQWPLSEGARECLPILLASITGRFDDVFAALEVLKKMGPAVGKSQAAQGSVLKFIAALQHESEHVRLAAAWILGEIGNPKAIAPLKEGASSGSGDLKKACSEALQKIGVG